MKIRGEQLFTATCSKSSLAVMNNGIQQGTGHNAGIEENFKERDPLKALLRWENNIKASLTRNRVC
jgi:hypothetical protein